MIYIYICKLSHVLLRINYTIIIVLCLIARCVQCNVVNRFGGGGGGGGRSWLARACGSVFSTLLLPNNIIFFSSGFAGNTGYIILYHRYDYYCFLFVFFFLIVRLCFQRAGCGLWWEKTAGSSAERARRSANGRGRCWWGKPRGWGCSPRTSAEACWSLNGTSSRQLTVSPGKHDNNIISFFITPVKRQTGDFAITCFQNDQTSFNSSLDRI